MKERMIVIGGLIDFQLSGNQSIKQTVSGMVNAYDVTYLSALPSSREGLDIDYLGEQKNFEIFRLPKFLGKAFHMCQRFYKSSSSGKNPRLDSVIQCPKRFEDCVDYFDNLNPGSMNKYRVLQFLYTFFEFFRLSYFIMKQRPSILYGVETYGGYVASLAGRMYGIRVVKRFQGTPLVINDGVIHNENTLRAFTSVYAINKGRDLVVMANDGTKGDEILDYLKVDRDNVFFEVNGFTMDHLQEVIPHCFGEGRHIVMLSKLKIWKRVDRGLRLFSKLLNEKQDVTLHVIGDGEMLHALVDLSRDLNIEKNVVFHGAVSNREALSMVSGCDLFWSFYDITNLGNPIMEAAYFERPLQTLYESSMAKLVPQSLMYNLSEIEHIVADAVQILQNNDLREERIEQVKIFKAKISTWPERMQKEICWIGDKLCEGTGE